MNPVHCPACDFDVDADVLEDTATTTTYECPADHRWAQIKAKPTVDAEPPQ